MANKLTVSYHYLRLSYVQLPVGLQGKGHPDTLLQTCTLFMSSWDALWQYLLTSNICLCILTHLLLWINNPTLRHQSIKVKAPIYKDVYCIIFCDSNKTGNKLNTHKQGNDWLTCGMFLAGFYCITIKKKCVNFIPVAFERFQQYVARWEKQHAEKYMEYKFIWHMIDQEKDVDGRRKEKEKEQR